MTVRTASSTTHGWVLYSSHQGYCSAVSDIMISVAFSWGYPSQTQSLRVGREQESPHLEEGGLCRRAEILARTNIPSDSTCKACRHHFFLSLSLSLSLMSELMRLSKWSSCPTAVVVQGQEAAWFPHKEHSARSRRPFNTRSWEPPRNRGLEYGTLKFSAL
ncbi:hypothetical protein G5714_005451 [Onychostoma macrolepis]|uniref:Uncharacterized protein n=1 Tax=Onychostoma macrolepis TaxID=369639 RepID=A0A7J6D124_9TELE|nr:hypothetical protein G5714_005451 [Onychostoma macrolepis]